MKVNTWRTAVVLLTAALVATVALSTAAASSKALTLTIWADANRAPAVTKIANSWAAANGATIKVVTKDFGSIRSNLGTVAAADAPDVVLAAHDWTGELAANGLVEPLYPSAAIASSSPSTRSTRSRTAPP